MNLDNLVTIEGASARLGKSLATTRRRVNAGDLEQIRVLGRVLYRIEDVDKLKAKLDALVGSKKRKKASKTGPTAARLAEQQLQPA
jgi:hypothetical protein